MFRGVQIESVSVLGCQITEPQRHNTMGDLVNDNRINKNKEIEANKNNFLSHTLKNHRIYITQKSSVVRAFDIRT